LTLTVDASGEAVSWRCYFECISSFRWRLLQGHRVLLENSKWSDSRASRGSLESATRSSSGYCCSEQPTSSIIV